MITTQGKHISHSLPSTLQKKKKDGKNKRVLIENEVFVKNLTVNSAHLKIKVIYKQWKWLLCYPLI